MNFLCQNLLMKYKGNTQSITSFSQKLRTLLINVTKIETSFVREMFKQILISIISNCHKSLLHCENFIYFFIDL